MFRRTLIAASLVAGLASAANAATHVYNLNGSLTDSLGGNPLVSLGGTLGATSYTFGPNQGLTLNLSGIINGSGPYTIETRFAFTDTTGYRKILDFQGQTQDVGLYNLNTDVNVYNEAFSTPGVFAPGVFADLLISRDAAGNVIVKVNGVTELSFLDSGNVTSFSPGDIATFFADDGATGYREASGGVVDWIKVSDFVSGGGVPEPGAWAMMVLGIGAIGWTMRSRRAGKVAAR